MIGRITVWAALLLFAQSLFPGESSALIFSTAEGGFRFSFSNPGARANGMGGAFIGVADDATAAYANPAGLTILTKPEYSLEYRYNESEARYVEFNSLNAYEYSNYTSSLSFMSFVYPMEKSTVSIFRHQLVDYSNELVPPGGTMVYKKLQGTVTGVSTGMKISEGLSAGFTAGILDLDFSTINITDDNDSEETYSASLLWNPSENLGVGLVYHYGPETNTFKGNVLNTLDIPDVYAIGVSYRPISNLLISADLNHVKYSDLLNNYLFNTGQTSWASTYGTISVSDFEIEDTNEIRLGMEYVFSLGETPLALRAGFAMLPEHNIKYTGNIQEFRILFPESEDEEVYSAGFGVVLDNIQLDLAANYSDLVKEGIFSFVYRFN